MMQPPKGQVMSVSRRFIQLRSEAGALLMGKSATKALEISVGDWVTFHMKGDDVVVDSIEPRHRVLERQYFSKRKVLASNLDLLLVVTATDPLCNVRFIDRITTAARCAEIPFLIVVNKVDLGLDDTAPLLAPYEALSYPLCYVSALNEIGLDALETTLNELVGTTVALAGISGVGKTSLLNRLIPSASSRTAEVSERTGQGKQTTSQPQGYLYTRGDSERLLIDLPGLSSYGVAFLTPAQVRSSFPEFEQYREGCRYLDCAHISESECGVTAALAEGLISSSRYESYLDILAEIDQARPY